MGRTAGFMESQFGSSGKVRIHGLHDRPKKGTYKVELKDESVRKFSQTGKTGMKELKKKYKDFM